MSYHTTLYHTTHTVYTIPAHTVIYDTVQHIYTHTLIYSDTPSHDLLLLHKDIHIIPVYTSPSAMSYIIIYHTDNRIQKQDRQQTDIRQKDIKKKRYISTASVSFTKDIIDCFLCSTACRYDKLVIILQNL